MKARMHMTAATVLLLMTTPVQAADHASESRLEDIQRRGAQVMPFSLERTTHVFDKTDRGGVQQVVAQKESDTEQIKLIREHLLKIAGEFARGDFSDPERIHGKDMPGLTELRNARPGQIKIEYKDLRLGAQIEYATDDPKLRDAIHRWFDAQLSDHARHAVPGSDHHHPQNP